MSRENELNRLAKVIDKDKRDISIDDIISNPISCGYLLDFCQKSVRRHSSLSHILPPC